jgi:hypothetical protein
MDQASEEILQTSTGMGPDLVKYLTTEIIDDDEIYLESFL